MKFSIKDFLSKRDQIHRKLQIWSHLLKKSLMENFIFVQCNLFRCYIHRYSAFAHFQDMMRVRSLPEFATSSQADRHEEKKVMIVTIDGGPYENLRYEKTINCSIKYFAENGPGPSEFNRVDRRT